MANTTYRITIKDGFRIYAENDEFKSIIDTGNFQCVVERDGSGNMKQDENGDMWCYYVIRHDKYVYFDDNSRDWLTDYAKDNVSECALQFTLQ